MLDHDLTAKPRQTNCLWCGALIIQKPVGRTRIWCRDAHKMRGYRRRHGL